MWWLLANAVMALHVALFVLLAAGVLLAAAGWMRSHGRISRVFWPALVVTLGWQALPGCILTDLERWLRRQDQPGWDRQMSLARTITGELTGVYPSEGVFAALAGALAVLALLAAARYHGSGVRALVWRGRART